MKTLLSLDIGGYNVSPPPLGKFDSATTSLGDIISEFLKYLFPLAGLVLFLYLIWGGFSFLTSGGDPKAMEQARGKVTNAVIGFVIIFLAYWLVQILEFMLNISVF